MAAEVPDISVSPESEQLPLGDGLSDPPESDDVLQTWRETPGTFCLTPLGPLPRTQSLNDIDLNDRYIVVGVSSNKKDVTFILNGCYSLKLAEQHAEHYRAQGKLMLVQRLDLSQAK